MRGLAFPSSAISDREPSYEYGTPNNVDDIPIDPALGAPAIDPALMSGNTGTGAVQVSSRLRSGLPVRPQRVASGQLYFTILKCFSPQIQPVAHPPPLLPTPHQQFSPTRQYSQGPQGDPFAPPPMPTYLPIQPGHAPPPKPLKRKRKPRREEECGFCQGSDKKNKNGIPEQMVTCDECARSGTSTIHFFPPV